MTPPPLTLMPYNYLIHVYTDAHPGLKWSQENLRCRLLAGGGGVQHEHFFGNTGSQPNWFQQRWKAQSRGRYCEGMQTKNTYYPVLHQCLIIVTDVRPALSRRYMQADTHPRLMNPPTCRRPLKLLIVAARFTLSATWFRPSRHRVLSYRL